jgi:hypothetical protein
LNNHIIALVSTLILLPLCENIAAVAQQGPPLNDRINQNDSETTSLNLTKVRSEQDNKHSPIVWLKSNETEADDDNTLVLNVTRQDFWKMFDQLFRYKIKLQRSATSTLDTG